MVQLGLVLGHVISKKGIEVDKTKVDLTAYLPPPRSVRDIRSFLGMLVFIGDSYKISARLLAH